MLKMIRLELRPTVENPKAAPLYLDVAVKGDVSHKVLGYAVPFILYSTGMIDFGHEIPDRYGRLNLHDGKIVEGRRLCLTCSDGEQYYQIATCHLLMEGQ